MLRLFKFLMLSVAYFSPISASSHLDTQDLVLPRVVNQRSNPAPDGLVGGPNHVVGRGISQDPSCPNGFLCVQQACPANVYCPVGENCVNFEGTSACGVTGPKICALNPTTLEAVGCNGGVCCHGNCYTAGTVCCDFPTIQCNVGELCNACNPGQTCGNGQCVGPTSSTSTSRSSTTLSIPSVPSQSTSATPSSSTTAFSSSTTSLSSSTTALSSSTTALSSSTTSTAPIPTVVPSSGEYSNTGCFVDLVAARVLVADQQVDLSSTGMTVEKCVAFARSGFYQYAGVEWGGECFVGNTLHGAVRAAQADCNQVCAGNSLELCGAGNRIQIYTDPTWHNPTKDDLVLFLQQYTDSLTRAQKALADYHDDLVGLRDALAADPGLRARTLTQTEVQYEMDILSHVGTLRLVGADIAQAQETGHEIFETAASNDVPEPIVNGAQLSDALNMLDDAASSVSDAASIATDDSASIAESVATSTAPLLDFGARIATVSRGLQSLGLPAVIAGVATGLFLVLAGLLAYFLGGSNGGGNPNPPCTTITAPACTIGCSVTNFGDTSLATTCYTTACTDNVGCYVRPSTTTTATTTSLCVVSAPPIVTWTPVPGAQMPFLGANNVWSTRT